MIIDIISFQNSTRNEPRSNVSIHPGWEFDAISAPKLITHKCFQIRTNAHKKSAYDALEQS